MDQFPARNAAAALREPATSMVRKGRLIGTTRAAEKPLDAFWPSAAPNLHVQDVLERVGTDHAKADQARSVLWRSLV